MYHYTDGKLMLIKMKRTKSVGSTVKTGDAVFFPKSRVPSTVPGYCNLLLGK